MSILSFVPSASPLPALNDVLVKLRSEETRLCLLPSTSDIDSPVVLMCLLVQSIIAGQLLAPLVHRLNMAICYGCINPGHFIQSYLIVPRSSIISATLLRLTIAMQKEASSAQ